MKKYPEIFIVQYLNLFKSTHDKVLSSADLEQGFNQESCNHAILSLLGINRFIF